MTYDTGLGATISLSNPTTTAWGSAAAPWNPGVRTPIAPRPVAPIVNTVVPRPIPLATPVLRLPTGAAIPLPKPIVGTLPTKPVTVAVAPKPVTPIVVTPPSFTSVSSGGGGGDYAGGGAVAAQSAGVMSGFDFGNSPFPLILAGLAALFLITSKGR